MKVLVCGDRNWTNKDSIWWALYGFPKDTVIIHSLEDGVSKLASKIAVEFGYQEEIYIADFDCNREMLEVGNPALVIVFTKDIKENKDDRDIASRAKKAGVPVVVMRG